MLTGRVSNKDIIDLINSLDTRVGEVSAGLSGTLITGSWINVPMGFRLVFSGNGSISINTLSANNTITNSAFVYTSNSWVNEVHSYLAEDVIKIQPNFSSNVTVSLIG